MWLYVPSESSSCAPDTPACRSDSDTPEWPTEPWVTLSGIPTQRPPSWRGWKTRPWIELLSGTMSTPSTARSGVDAWTSSLRDSPASLGPLPVEAVELTTTVGSGRRSSGSSATWDPTTCSWKTSPDSTLAIGVEQECSTSSRILPQSGSMRSGACSPRKPLERRTHGTGYGSWGTPVAQDDQKSPDAHLAMKERMGGGRVEPTSLTVQSKIWATPTSRDSAGSGAMYPSGDGYTRQTLTDQTVRMWESPKARDWRSSAGDSTEDRKSPDLNVQAANWPTPRASPNENRTRKRAPTHDNVAHGSTLSGEAHHLQGSLWPTPTASAAARGSDPMRTNARAGSPTLRQVAESGLQTGKTSRDGETGLPVADLNPYFVERLMGLPEGWSNPSVSLTASISSATDSSHSAQPQLSCSSPNEQE